MEKQIDLAAPISIEEMIRLSRYASENGIKGTAAMTAKLFYLVDRIREQEGKKLYEIEEYQQALVLYSRLIQYTDQVSGRTLIETEHSGEKLNKLLLLTLGLTVFIAIIGGLNSWLMEQPQPEEGIEYVLYFINSSFLDYLTPFIWGALGACVYILKQLYDLAQAQKFDRTKFQGWTIRLLLGAILGGFIHEIYSLSELGAGSTEFSKNAIAFFTGLSVKLIYGAFQKTVESLAQKMGLETISKGADQEKDMKSMLAQELVNTDEEADPERYHALLELLNKYKTNVDLSNKTG